MAAMVPASSSFDALNRIAVDGGPLDEIAYMTDIIFRYQLKFIGEWGTVTGPYLVKINTIEGDERLFYQIFYRLAQRSETMPALDRVESGETKRTEVSKKDLSRVVNESIKKIVFQIQCCPPATLPNPAE